MPDSLLSPTARGIARVLALALALMTGPALAGAEEDAPPSSRVPESADLSQLGVDSTESAAGDLPLGMKSLAEELRRIGEVHGPDSVVLQAKLLLRATAAGAVGPTEVRVAGSSQRLGTGYLEIDVDSGLMLDAESSPAQRRERIWRAIAKPVLAEMRSFQIRPEALELVLVYDVAGADAERSEPASASHAEEARFALDRALLEEIAAREIAADDILKRIEASEVAPHVRAPRHPAR